MNFLIRTDASYKIGTGHVMRCLTLAEELKDRGHRVEFLCREKPGNLISLIQDQGYPVHGLRVETNDVDPFHIGGELTGELEALEQIAGRMDSKPILVIDHYGIDALYESQARSHVQKIMVIDDLASREHDCDVLLDQNYGASEEIYRKLVPEHCTLLLGPRYALLRKEFQIARKKIEAADRRSFAIENVMVFFGGSDSENYTSKALQALRELKHVHNYQPGVVIGQNHPCREEVRSLVDSMPGAKLFIQTNRIAEIMMESSWYLGAGGSITWERMALGLPGVVLPVAENQMRFAKALEREDYQFVVNGSENLKRFIATKLNPEDLQRMGKSGFKLVDGFGSQRVADYL